MAKILITEKLQNLTDAQLVEASSQNKEAFYYLMERYEGRLLRYIHRLTNVSDTEAEDILQDIFIKVYRNLNGFDPDLSFSSWIYRIARNEIINHYHKSKRQRELESLDDDPEAFSNLFEIISEEPDGYQTYIKKEQAQAVHKVLEELPQKYREVLILYYLEGMSYTEISDILRKPPGTVATLLKRAKDKFKKIATKYHLKS